MYLCSKYIHVQYVHHYFDNQYKECISMVLFKYCTNICSTDTLLGLFAPYVVLVMHEKKTETSYDVPHFSAHSALEPQSFCPPQLTSMCKQVDLICHTCSFVFMCGWTTERLEMACILHSIFRRLFSHERESDF